MELVPERLVAGGDVLAHEPSGRVVFVAGALPGERVRVRLVRQKRDYAKAVVEEVLEPSAMRVAPPCPFVAAGCGGCTWQFVDPDHQLALKVGILADAFRRTAGLPQAFVGAGPALPPWGFRTTLRLGIRNGRAGYRRRASHDVVPVDSCAIAHPRLVELLAGARFPGAGEVTLRCSAATGERLALVEPDGTAEGLPADVLLGPGAHVTEEVEGRRFRVSAGSFFQTRPDGAAVLARLVEEAVEDVVTGARLADLYAGVGLFAGTVGQAAADVVAVEVAPSSVADLRVNLPAARVVESAVEAWAPEPAEVVVADPPRTGLGRGGVDAVAATGASRLALVSCDPVSLARDAALLQGHGFRHVRSMVVDLFPHTPHVEVVSRFDR
jgi:23S rRNA (uracil1939-C5)-methyltransferase